MIDQIDHVGIALGKRARDRRSLKQDLRADGVVLFGHKGWKQAGEFYMHCNSKWGFFLGTSLKDYVETGKGRPAPEDPDL